MGWNWHHHKGNRRFCQNGEILVKVPLRHPWADVYNVAKDGKLQLNRRMMAAGEIACVT
ncbi:hypothetical protein D3C75_1310030 [compost metagenome]